MKLFQVPSPVQKLESSFLAAHNVELFVKRDDLIHPEISGNKWRKLKYNFQEAERQAHMNVLTFGGAFSNHLAATAVAAHQHELKSIGVVRGERAENLSPTLKACERYGMELKFVSRSTYAKKGEDEFAHELSNEFGDFYLIPEGGANDLGCKGCEEIIKEEELNVDVVAVASGTGTTAAGILSAIGTENLICVSSLKGGAFLEDNILQYKSNRQKKDKLNLLTEYHFGGYAKVNQQLIDFVNQFYKDYNVQLDLVYTAKLFFALFDLISKSCFPKGTRIMVVHTGGLQGNKGFEEQKGIKLFQS